jgi:hypothetical protein
MTQIAYRLGGALGRAARTLGLAGPAERLARWVIRRWGEPDA